MVATRFIDHVETGDHASRPAATAVPQGTLYSCTDHTLIYQSDGATWSTWMDPAGAIPGGLTLPSFVAAGTSATGTGDVTPGVPAGSVINDILLIFVQSDNQAATAPAGYAKLGPFCGIGTAAAAGGTRLTVFWKRHDGSEPDPTVTDTGDHTLAQMISIRGCPTSGDPFLNVGVLRKLTASTTGTAPAGATPVDNCLVINAFVHALDSSSAVFSSPTNADLANVTERIDVGTTDGNGGGIGVFTGEKVSAGSFTGTTVTETSTTDVAMTFIMLPEAIDSRAGFIDRQVFLTPGVDDTWTRPTGAKRLSITAIAGGASGSAGRNAATAAGGGGGGGGGFGYALMDAGAFSTATVTVGAGGAATANTDGAASNAGNLSRIVSGSYILGQAQAGQAAGVSATGSGGTGGAGGTITTNAAASATGFGAQGGGGGAGGTTAGAGGNGADFGGGGGAGGGTTQATSAGGFAMRAGGGGGGGRSNTNVGTGGAGANSWAGGSSAGAAGTDSSTAEMGGGGGAGGTSAAGPGGQGGWPGGGGGGGGSQSGAQRGGAGGDGVVVIVTYC